jgi:putative ABC transport system ATP-binding protein
MALECKNINFSFKDKLTNETKHILDNMSFSLKKNEIKLVYGHIGVGKSTLIYILSGLLENFKGEVFWDDYKFTKMHYKLDNLRSNYMSMNFSNFFYIKDMDVEHNIMFPAIFSNKDKEYINDRLSMIYKSFSEIRLSSTERFNLIDYKHKKIGTLSNGQREIVMLARMLINDSKYILADEMLRSFNTNVKKQMLSILFSKFGLGVDNGVLLVTHDDKMKEYMEEYAPKSVKITAYDFKNKHLEERL